MRTEPELNIFKRRHFQPVYFSWPNWRLIGRKNGAMVPTYKVATLLYPGADILDFSGPVEIYSTSPPPGKERAFITTTFSHVNPVTVAANAFTYTPDKSLPDIAASIEEYDILLIPGAWPQVIEDLVGTDDGKKILALVQKFAALPPRKETGHRVIQSVCTGALILGASGILANRTVTTHHLSYEKLKEMADEAAGGESHIDILRKKRWVDAGKTEAGVRIINAGGVSSGLDASLWIVEELAGKDFADWTANIVEFERRGKDDGWSN
ncbi:transcriptional regulator [Lophiotrema nucula]|uniref:Transcriptional regulator n=1 Tax=Lophiotrema nucula TaxID=690887 RepID=A0A6A5YIF8_9PLEO|nr:transcriptional regulator [Lophiotrema nucula]